MIKRLWALQGMDGEIFQVFADKPMGEVGPFDDLVEIDYNDEPVTDAGHKMLDDIKAEIERTGLVQLHMDKRAGFYLLSGDERIQMLYDIVFRKWEENAHTLTEEELSRF